MLSSIELIKILSKNWANINDIKILANCGRDNARKIRDKITTEIIKSGKFLPTSKQKLVPMTYVIDYLNIDVDHITDMALKEKSITV